jgi:hypothetical protein
MILSAFAAVVALALMAAATAVNASMAAAATHLQSTTVTEPINAVKLLADFDPHFNSYMKVGWGRVG